MFQKRKNIEILNVEFSKKSYANKKIFSIYNPLSSIQSYSFIENKIIDFDNITCYLNI